jgi:Ca-activated chloride channel family protein
LLDLAAWGGPWTIAGQPARLDAPWLLPLAPVVALALALLRRWQARRRAARLARLGSAGPAGHAGPRTRWQGGALVLAALLASLALTGPRWGLDQARAVSRGLDVVLAIDASASMLATDERPSRLEAVKQEVRRLRALAPADRVALIAFAGRSYILTPLTTDDGALDLFLENLDPSIVGQPGSAVARAIRQGTELLAASAGDGADRALVVFSDGELFEPTEEILREAAQAAEQRVALVTVGMGTTAGSTIPVRDGALVREKRDEAGQVIVTRYTPEKLEGLARAAGGTFIPAETADKAGAVRRALGSLRRSSRVLDTSAGLVPRYAWLLWPALLLLLLERWLAAGVAPADGHGGLSSPPTAAATKVTRTAASLAALLLLPGCYEREAVDPLARWAAREYGALVDVYRDRLASGDGSAEVRYNLGTALLAADSVDQAIDPLEGVDARLQATPGAADELVARTRFNLGLAHLLRGRRLEALSQTDAAARAAFDAALASYRAYLQDRPDDLDAKWNYELALRRQPPPPPSQGGGGGGGSGGDAEPPPPPGTVDQSQADALLNSAAREERAVQGRRPRQPRGAPPPGGKDW